MPPYSTKSSAPASKSHPETRLTGTETIIPDTCGWTRIDVTRSIQPNNVSAKPITSDPDRKIRYRPGISMLTRPRGTYECSHGKSHKLRADTGAF